MIFGTLSVSRDVSGNETHILLCAKFPNQMKPDPRTPYRISLSDPDGSFAVPAFAGIYRLLCRPMGKAYVGQTRSLPLRYIQHRDLLAQNRHDNTKLQQAYVKYGPRAFEFQVLEIYHGLWAADCLSPAEQRWMDEHGWTDRGCKLLFNMRPAGSDEYIAAAKRLSVSAATKSPSGS